MLVKEEEHEKHVQEMREEEEKLSKLMNLTASVHKKKKEEERRGREGKEEPGPSPIKHLWKLLGTSEILFWEPQVASGSLEWSFRSTEY